jgi:hypothetical protein
MKCGGKCENVKLQMGDYFLKTRIFTFKMGNCDIVLGVIRLRTLGPITMYVLELYMRFKKNEHFYTLKGIKVGSPKIVSSHSVEKLLKKGRSCITS